jgi:hypothetical protein
MLHYKYTSTGTLLPGSSKGMVSMDIRGKRILSSIDHVTIDKPAVYRLQVDMSTCRRFLIPLRGYSKKILLPYRTVLAAAAGSDIWQT